jgi:hypothetical protein
VHVDTWRLYTTGDLGYVSFLQEIVECTTEIVKAIRTSQPGR